MNTISKTLFASLSSIALLASLAACAGGQSEQNPTPSATMEHSMSSDAEMNMDGSAGVVEGIDVKDAWSKAAGADEAMTASYATLENTTDQAITFVSAKSDVADMVELHETVMGENGQMKMQKKPGGFTLQPGEELELKPEGNHLMLMMLTGELKAGQSKTFTLISDQNKSFEFTSVVKDFAGGNENYSG